MSIIRWLACLAFTAASFAGAATTDKIIQWPIPDPNGPVVGSQEQKAMLPETATHHTEMVSKLLKAVAQNNRDEFLFRGTAEFQKADPKSFQILVSRWAERLKDGIRVSPISELRRSYATSMWRVQFVAGGDEALILLSTDKRGNIVTFQLQ